MFCSSKMHADANVIYIQRAIHLGWFVVFGPTSTNYQDVLAIAGGPDAPVHPTTATIAPHTPSAAGGKTGIAHYQLHSLREAASETYHERRRRMSPGSEPGAQLWLCG